jgi:hypothetical protein
MEGASEHPGFLLPWKELREDGNCFYYYDDLVTGKSHVSRREEARREKTAPLRPPRARRISRLRDASTLEKVRFAIASGNSAAIHYTGGVEQPPEILAGG